MLKDGINVKIAKLNIKKTELKLFASKKIINKVSKE